MILITKLLYVAMYDTKSKYINSCFKRVCRLAFQPLNLKHATPSFQIIVYTALYSSALFSTKLPSLFLYSTLVA